MGNTPAVRRSRDGIITRRGRTVLRVESLESHSKVQRQKNSFSHSALIKRKSAALKEKVQRPACACPTPSSPHILHMGAHLALASSFDTATSSYIRGFAFGVQDRVYAASLTHSLLICPCARAWSEGESKSPLPPLCARLHHTSLALVRDASPACGCLQEACRLDEMAAPSKAAA